jgi:methionyl-tRNA formyltransferase
VTADGLRVVYFGTPDFAVPTLERLLASSHHVVGVVTQPDRPRGRGQKVTVSPVKRLAADHGLPVLQPTNLRTDDALAALRALQPDIGVVAAYGRLLPQAVLDLPPRGLINVHASLLPRWRGAAPIHRAVMAGDAVTGVTIMRVVLAVDAGPMLAQVDTPIVATDTSESLERRLAILGGDLLVQTLDQLAHGPLAEIPQDEAAVTYAAKLTRGESQVDWTKPAGEIERRVRGLQPWPLAVARVADRPVALLEARALAGSPAAPPGTVLGQHADGWHIACGEGILAVTVVKPEGRRPMPVRDFLNGAHLPSALVLQ